MELESRTGATETFSVASDCGVIDGMAAFETLGVDILAGGVELATPAIFPSDFVP